MLLAARHARNARPPHDAQAVGRLGLCLIFGFTLTHCSHDTAFRRGGTGPATHRDILTRVLLVGDAGHSEPDTPVLKAVRERAEASPDITTVVYLGDNVYPAGLPEATASGRSAAEAHLRAQIQTLLPTTSEAIFVPGNHDWDNSGPDGWHAIKRQAAFIAQQSNGRFRLLPTGGTPGPVCEDRPGVRLIFLDTQWWLHNYRRPAVTEADVLAKLRVCLNTATGREVLLVAHHPLQTHGPHGGFSSFQDHVFPLTRLHAWMYVPLPLLGSIYTLVRQHGVSSQDLSGVKNQRMVRELSRVLAESTPLLFAAGHEHSLQVLRGTRGTQFHLVSGSGSATTDVGDGADTLFAQEALGFLELEFTIAKRVLLTVHAAAKDGAVVPVWRYVLK